MRVNRKKIGFYTYTHARPDGSVFYVGKGKGARAWDFSPTRRTLHHLNIITKYGAANIAVVTYPHSDEAEAFAHEIKMIADMREAGVKLINLTDGGEGTSGRTLSEDQRARIAASVKRVWAKREITPEKRAQLMAQLEHARLHLSAWHQSAEGRANALAMAAKSRAWTLAQPKRKMICGDCSTEFESRSNNVICCSKLCQQRLRRRRESRVSREVGDAISAFAV